MLDGAKLKLYLHVPKRALLLFHFEAIPRIRRNWSWNSLQKDFECRGI
jgi:hypothetical protein